MTPENRERVRLHLLQRMRERLGREPTKDDHLTNEDLMLTPEEEADLRQHSREADAYFRAAFAHLRPKGMS
jgi:hypothetical protein